MRLHPVHHIQGDPLAGRLQKGAAAAEKGSSFNFVSCVLLSRPPTAVVTYELRYRRGILVRQKSPVLNAESDVEREFR